MYGYTTPLIRLPLQVSLCFLSVSVSRFGLFIVLLVFYSAIFGPVCEGLCKEFGEVRCVDI